MDNPAAFGLTRIGPGAADEPMMTVCALEPLAQAWHLQTDFVIRLLASVILGGLIGLEREVRDKPAGFRTIILICVGACLFTILSEAVGGPDWNSTRIAAQIVTGIGFIGAGSILRSRVNVYGLTTAATIWSVAAIGMAAGFGHLALAVLGTAVILASLLLLDVIEEWISRWYDIQEYHFAAPNTEGVFDNITKLFTEAKLRTRKRTWHEEDDLLVFRIRAMGAKSDHVRLRMTLAHSRDYTLRRS